MKYITFLFALFFAMRTQAQMHIPLPHGTVFGAKPDMTAMMPASKVEAFMGKRGSVNTTLRGRVIKVTQPKGGWFEMDAGNGRVIAAHFKTAGIDVPVNLQGRIVIAEGVVIKQFIEDDLQHFAGDTVAGKKQHHVNADPKRRLSFEVKGLMVDQ